MPKTYLTVAERKKADFLKDRDKQIRAIQGELASTKYSVPMREIESQVNFSRQVIKKVRNNPIDATLGQIFAVCNACGKRVVITIE